MAFRAFGWIVAVKGGTKLTFMFSGLQTFCNSGCNWIAYEKGTLEDKFLCECTNSYEGAMITDDST